MAMIDWLRAAVRAALKVPPDPVVDATPGSRCFRAAPNHYRYRVTIWLVAQTGAFLGLCLGTWIFPNASDFGPSLARSFAWFSQILAWTTFVVQLPFSWVLLRLNHENRWYMLTDESLQLRQGVATIQEQTITFANVQQIDIRRNPLQRLLGIADVRVRSAGGGSGTSGSGDSGGGREAIFRGVDNPEEIRRAIRDRVEFSRGTGLGDPDEPVPPAGDPETAAAAGELLRQMVLTRTSLQQRLGSVDLPPLNP